MTQPHSTTPIAEETPNPSTPELGKPSLSPQPQDCVSDNLLYSFPQSGSGSRNWPTSTAPQPVGRLLNLVQPVSTRNGAHQNGVPNILNPTVAPNSAALNPNLPAPELHWNWVDQLVPEE